MGSVKRNSEMIVKGATAAVALVLQVLIFLFLGFYVQQYFTWIYVVLEIISLILIFALVNDQESYKQVWVIIVLVLPVTGLLLYYMWGSRRPNSRSNVRYRETEAKMQSYTSSKPELLEGLKEDHPNKAQLSYLLESEGFHLYDGTDVHYFPLGEQMLAAMIEDMKKAEKCIFLEYFIVSEGEIWNQVKEVLKEKAQEGLDIRLLIDDFGCLNINTASFRHEMSRAGIRLGVFAPIHKEVTRFSFNYRNHQKITIIDGNVGYCGGINLADEYANLFVKYGHWKDTAVRLEGEGVWGLTSIFLNMWEVTMRYDITNDYSMYMPSVRIEGKGYVQPFSDGPAINPKTRAEDAYIEIINKARNYVYFTSPYLVLERRMMEDLCRVARSGVDVRVVVPHIPDKWYVYKLNIANYGPLMAAGVKVYEYTPGFIHSKTIVSDDECAVCGTINTDFRSFYLHYECGVYMCECQAVTDIRDDILSTIEKSEEINYDDWLHRPVKDKMQQWLLKVFQAIL